MQLAGVPDRGVSSRLREPEDKPVWLPTSSSHTHAPDLENTHCALEGIHDPPARTLANAGAARILMNNRCSSACVPHGTTEAILTGLNFSWNTRSKNIYKDLLRPARINDNKNYMQHAW